MFGSGVLYTQQKEIQLTRQIRTSDSQRATRSGKIDFRNLEEGPMDK